MRDRRTRTTSLAIAGVCATVALTAVLALVVAGTANPAAAATRVAHRAFRGVTHPAGFNAGGFSNHLGPAPRLGYAPSGNSRVSHASFHAPTGTQCWTSQNWSGYALSENPVNGVPCVAASGVAYTSVSGSWTVPTVSPSQNATYSSEWVGIDGFTDQQLIQAGTEQDSANGQTSYSAWWEVVPDTNGSQTISQMTVKPGDSITVAIAQSAPGSGTWDIAVTDNGNTVTIPTAYSGPDNSAEWIEEAPSTCRNQSSCTPLLLANYGTVTFDNASANGAPVRFNASSYGVLLQGKVQGALPTNGSTVQSARSAGTRAPSRPTCERVRLYGRITTVCGCKQIPSAPRYSVCRVTICFKARWEHRRWRPECRVVPVLVTTPTTTSTTSTTTSSTTTTSTTSTTSTTVATTGTSGLLDVYSVPSPPDTGGSPVGDGFAVAYEPVSSGSPAPAQPPAPAGS